MESTLLPIRCFTCGKVFNQYIAKNWKDLKLRYCCNSILLSHESCDNEN